jgi:hypothetical protein
MVGVARSLRVYRKGRVPTMPCQGRAVLKRCVIRIGVEEPQFPTDSFSCSSRSSLPRLSRNLGSRATPSIMRLKGASPSPSFFFNSSFPITSVCDEFPKMGVARSLRLYRKGRVPTAPKPPAA